MEPRAARRGDVHRHRVADVGDPARLDLGEVHQRVVEDRRVGLRHADDVAVDDAAHRDMRHRRRPGRPRGRARSRSGRSRSTPHPSGCRRPRVARAPTATRGSPTATAVRDGSRPSRSRRLDDVGLGHTDRSHVRLVVRVQSASTAPAVDLAAIARVVGSTVHVDRAIAAVVREQRAEHGRIGQHEHAARVEEQRVETEPSLGPLSRVARAGTPMTSGQIARIRLVVLGAERVVRGHERVARCPDAP